FGTRDASRADGFIAGVASGARNRSRKYSDFLRVAKTSELGTRKAGTKVGAIGPAAQLNRMLCAWRTLSSAFNFVDDGDSGAGRGSERYSSGLASSCSGDSGGSSAVGSV